MGDLRPLVESATAESIVAKRGTTTTNGAGDGSTVVDAGLTEANDYWNDMTLLILSGACDGQSRDITDFAGGTLTVSPVFANQVLSGVRYFILPIKPSAAEVEDIKGTGFVKDTDSLVDLSHTGEYATEMARITDDVATEAKQDVIDGYHDVPVEDVATDAQMRDVVGKKSDTVAGTSIVAISKQVKAKTDNIPASPAPSGEYDTQLDANMSTRAPASEYDTEMARITANVATEAKQDTIDGIVDDIKVSTNKLAGDAPSEDSTTKNWNTINDSPDGSGGIVTTIGVGATRKKVLSLLLDVNSLTAASVIKVKLFIKINGTSRKVYEENFTVGTDPDGLWIVDGALGIHDILTIVVYSDTNESVAIGYTIVTEAM